MSNLFKRFFTHKSKFLLIILCLLGLAFSYSCSCRNESTDPNTPTPTPDGKKNFSPNVDVQSSTLRVKSDSSIYGNSQIIIKFGEDNNANFTVSIDSVEDTDSTDKLTLDNNDYKKFNKSTGKFELTSTGLKKVADLKTDTKPADKKIKINFKIEAIDKDKFNTPEATITEEIHLIKVKEIDTDYIFTTLQSSTGCEASIEGIDNPDANTIVYDLKDAKNSSGAISISPKSDKTDKFNKNTTRRKVIYQFNELFKTAGIDKTEAADEVITSSGKDITFKVKFTFNENYDGSKISNPMEVIIKGGSNTWE